MADFHSGFTGIEIEAALARAKAGGAIDEALSEKATVEKPTSISATLADGVTGIARCWKTQDGEVSICLEITKDTAFSTWENFATLPEGYRPSAQHKFGLIGTNGSAGTLAVYVDGSISINSYIGSGIKSFLAYGRFVASN